MGPARRPGERERHLVEDQRLFAARPEAAAHRAVRPDSGGVIRLDVTPTRSPDIQLSWVMVAQEERQRG